MKVLMLAMLAVAVTGCVQAPGQRMPDADISRYIDKETGVACYTVIGPRNRAVSCVQVREGNEAKSSEAQEEI